MTGMNVARSLSTLHFPHCRLRPKYVISIILSDVISTCNIGKHFNDPRSWELSKSTPTKMVGIIMGFL